MISPYMRNKKNKANKKMAKILEEAVWQDIIVNRTQIAGEMVKEVFRIISNKEEMTDRQIQEELQEGEELEIIIDVK